MLHGVMQINLNYDGNENAISVVVWSAVLTA